MVEDQRLCTRTTDATRVNRQFTPHERYRATLVFVSGPNRAAKGHLTGSTIRTLNTRAVHEYDFFRSCVRAAVRAGLDAMIQARVNVALVARVSCGLYAGKLTCEDRFCCPGPPRGVSWCRYDPSCTNRNCRFYHPGTPCAAFRAGACRAPQCPYAHEPCRQGRSYRQRICAEYRQMVDDLLREEVMAADGTMYARGRFFDLVVINLLH